MRVSRGTIQARKISRGATDFKRVSRGSEVIWRMLAGITNVKFNGIAAAILIPGASSWTTGPSLSIEPSSTDSIIGLLAMPLRLTSGSTSDWTFRMTRGSTAISQDFRTELSGYRRQLFVDKPGATSTQTYAMEGRRITSQDTFARFEAPSYLMGFEYPDGVVADVLASDLQGGGGWMSRP